LSSFFLDADRLADAVQMRLQEPLRRPDRRFRFVPQLSYGRHRGPAPSDSRPAAVALLLYPRNGRWCIPFTLRPRTMSTHAGQISLPGGATDPGESAMACVVRELQEEIGVAPEQVRVLGSLSPTYVYGSGFLVRPFVLLAAQTPTFQLNPEEVEELLEIPVSQLFDPARYGRLWIVRRMLRFETPCISHEHHRIWGATLKVLGEFLDLSENVFAGCPKGDRSQ
jgi:8-oxo-dGTP pyrophosphatase MutT (NUDIX family)